MANTLSTNASYPTPIDEAQIFQDLENLQSAYTNLVTQLEANICGEQSAANAGANSSIINSGGKRIVYTQHLSFGSITTITNCVRGLPFTIVVQSSGSYGMLDAGNFRLSAAFTPGPNDTLSLVWNGTQYIEVARTNN